MSAGLPPVGFVAALQFLTRIPIRLREAPPAGRAVPWFPLVGAAIGTIVGGTAAGLAELVPPSIAAAVAVIVGLTVTGAFHEDGLADTADAMGGWSPEQRREILRDSRHGSYGVAAMVGTIGLRTLCLAALGPATAFAGAVAAHTLGRAGAVALVVSAPPMSGDGLGAETSRSASTGRCAVGIVAGVAIAGLVTGWWIGPLALAAAVAAVGVGRLAVRAFGGVSGDHLGAAEQVGECLVLVTVVALAQRHDLWWT